MITLKQNANAMVKKLCYEDSVIAFYYSVCENYANGYIQPFVTNMQTLITKVGMIVSTVSTKKVYISYCYRSITYLCNTVLNKPELAKKFDQLGINAKGNKGKHSLENNKIDLDKAVQVFNELIDSITNKYNLPALKALLLSKRTKEKPNQDKRQQSYQSYYGSLTKQAPQKSNYASAPKANTPPKTKHANDEATISDELDVYLYAKLENGKGYYTKGLFNKKKMLNVRLLVDFPTWNYKFKSVTATFKCRGNAFTKKIPIVDGTYQTTEVEVDLDGSLFSGNITVTVVGIYKIGLFKTKQIKTTISKTF